MFNPQIDELEFREVYKGTKINKDNFSGINWTKTNMIDIKQGDLFKLVDPDGTNVTDKDGNTEFIAASDAYFDSTLKIPRIDIYESKKRKNSRVNNRKLK